MKQEQKDDYAKTDRIQRKVAVLVIIFDCDGGVTVRAGLIDGVTTAPAFLEAAFQQVIMGVFLRIDQRHCRDRHCCF